MFLESRPTRPPTDFCDNESQEGRGRVVGAAGGRSPTAPKGTASEGHSYALRTSDGLSMRSRSFRHMSVRRKLLSTSCSICNNSAYGMVYVVKSAATLPRCDTSKEPITPRGRTRSASAYANRIDWHAAPQGAAEVSIAPVRNPAKVTSADS